MSEKAALPPLAAEHVVTWFGSLAPAEQWQLLGRLLDAQAQRVKGGPLRESVKLVREYETVQTLWAEGHPEREIEKRTGIPRVTAGRRRRELGLLPHRPKRPEKQADDEPADRPGEAPQPVLSAVSIRPSSEQNGVARPRVPIAADGESEDWDAYFAPLKKPLGRGWFNCYPLKDEFGQFNGKWRVRVDKKRNLGGGLTLFQALKLVADYYLGIYGPEWGKYVRYVHAANVRVTRADRRHFRLWVRLGSRVGLVCPGGYWWDRSHKQNPRVYHTGDPQAVRAFARRWAEVVLKDADALRHSRGIPSRADLPLAPDPDIRIRDGRPWWERNAKSASSQG